MSHKVAKPKIVYRCVNANPKAVEDFFDYIFNKVTEEYYKKLGN